MGQQVCAGALTRCSFGTAPSTLMVLPQNGVFTGTPAATVMDNQPLVNVLPFVLCRSMGTRWWRRPRRLPWAAWCPCPACR